VTGDISDPSFEIADDDEEKVWAHRRRSGVSKLT
jgi:hypothetical protein